MPQRAKHVEYSSFSKRESPIVPEYYIYSALRSPKVGESKCTTKNVCSRSKIVNSSKRESRRAQNTVCLYSSHTNRESREKLAKDKGMRALRSEKGNASKRKPQ